MNMPHYSTIKYKDRTPDTIKQEFNSYTNEGAAFLADFLDRFMSNEHNGKQFVNDNQQMLKDGLVPSERIRGMLSSALDWFDYGN